MPVNVRKLRAKMVEHGYNIAKLSKAININTATMYRKINADGAFTLGEAHDICRVLSLSEEEAVSIFLPEYSQ